MKEKPHYESLLTRDFFQTHYIENKMSYPSIQEMLKKQGFNISVGCLYKYAKKYDFGRTISEARQQHQNSSLDWSKTLIDEPLIEAIDGFLLGDGGIRQNTHETAGKLRCGVEYLEFCAYQMSMFSVYQGIWTKVNDPSMNQGFRWDGRTTFHPDLYQQYLRWYPFVESKGKRDKQPPDDVRLTPTSVMLWYLGDGSLIIDEKANTVMLRISTDSFLPERVEFLADKLCDKGIACHRNNDNRIMVDAKGIPAFFNFIGSESPIKCYDYKFKLPEWRLSSKRMSEVAQELGVDYQRLAHLVKVGRVPCHRVTEKGKPRFLPEHIEACRAFIATGELY